MRLPGRNVQRVSAAVVFLIAGCAGEAAGQQEPGVGDPSAAAGGPPARSAGAQMRVPRVQPAESRSAENWSLGFRINWNVFRSSPIGVEDRHSLVTQCVEGGACLSSAASSSVFPANGGGNPGRMSPTGIMLDAGRMIAPGTELGVGLDVLSYTDMNDLSQGSFAGSTAGALRMVAGEHVQQMDLAGRVTYTFRVPDGAPVAQRRAWRRIGPYVGAGAGVSRYALRPPDGYPGAHRAVLSPILSAASPASVHGAAAPIRGWAPERSGLYRRDDASHSLVAGDRRRPSLRARGDGGHRYGQLPVRNRLSTPVLMSFASRGGPPAVRSGGRPSTGREPADGLSHVAAMISWCGCAVSRCRETASRFQR